MHLMIYSHNPLVLDAVARAPYNGVSATVCESSLELLGAVRVLASDLVILDLETPGLSPLLLVSAIKELSPGLPIVAVSTRPEADARGLSHQGVRYVRLGVRPEGDAPGLLAELSLAGGGEPGALGRDREVEGERCC
jgi:CheY-like chemotaxis protein